MSPTERSEQSPRSPAGRSDRWSDRVELAASATPTKRARQRLNAPESMPPHGAPAGEVAPERAGGNRRVGPDRLRLVRAELTAREWAILTSLQRHPFLTTAHLQSLHFVDHATDSAAGRIARRVLKRMGEQRLIEPLQRRVGGVRAGSAAHVWRIGLVGDRLLKQQSGQGTRARRKEPSPYYLDHRLAIADAHLTLLVAARAGQLELLHVQTEPASWRRYLGSHGGRETLKPDLFVVTANSEFEDSWFIEVDRGTESIPTLIRKCAQYEAYRRTGSEQHSRGVFPLVVWQLHNQARVDKLTAAIRAARRLDGDLYRLTTPEGLLGVVSGGAAVTAVGQTGNPNNN